MPAALSALSDLVALVAAAAILAPQPAQADDRFVNPVDTFIDARTNNMGSGMGVYAFGNVRLSDPNVPFFSAGLSSHSFIFFDLSSILAPGESIASASLILPERTFLPGTGRSDGPYTLALWSVESDLGRMGTASGIPGVDSFYNDLGGGASYGQFDVRPISQGIPTEFALNGLGLSAANTSRTASSPFPWFALGATASGAIGSNNAVWSGSGGIGLKVSVVGPNAAVPEPGTLALAGIGLAGIVAVGGRRRWLFHRKEKNIG